MNPSVTVTQPAATATGKPRGTRAFQRVEGFEIPPTVQQLMTHLKEPLEQIQRLAQEGPDDQFPLPETEKIDFHKLNLI